MDKEKIAEELVRKHEDFKSEGLSEYMNGYLNGAIAALEHIEQAGIYSNVSGKREIILFVEKQLSPQYMNDVFTWGAIKRALENYFTACASAKGGQPSEQLPCREGYRGRCNCHQRIKYIMRAALTKNLMSHTALRSLAV